MWGGNERTAPTDDLPRTRATEFAPASPRSAPLPAVIDRYRLLEQLGAGGCGAVYAAYDPNLDRRVAVKVLRPLASRAAADPKRLHREAQALAKLAHPNVVAVFDVGECGGHVFIAMELVAGRNLREWLHQRARRGEAGVEEHRADQGWRAGQTRGTWHELESVFVQAGRGLAAAHDAGIVHRDFKPDNVLVGTDGRVRVTDFGLARPGGTDAGSCLSSSDPQLTPQGLALGTPAYMAPEQHAGAPFDHRADQFGFCVALFEACFGFRPFQGGPLCSGREVLLAVRDAPTRITVPGRVRRVLARGLARNPAARYRSMRALLDDLAPRRRRRGIALALGGCGIAALAATLPFARPAIGAPHAPPCDETRSAAAQLWPREDADRVYAAFHAASAPPSVAAGAWARVDQALQRYATRWSAVHARVCSLGEKLPERVVAERVACLESRRLELSALIDVLDDPGDDVVTNAAAAVMELNPVDVCVGLDSARRFEAPELTQMDGDGYGALSRAKALAHVGEPDEAVALAAAVVQRAQRRADRALEAESTIVLAWIRWTHDLDLDVASAQLATARLAAAAAKRPDLEARALIELAVLDALEHRLQRAAAMADQAAAVLADYGDRWLEGRLAFAYGSIAYYGGDLSSARAHMARAVELFDAPGSAPQRGRALNVLGESYFAEGRYADALPRYRRFLAVVSSAYGPDHPWVARAHGNLGEAYAALGDHVAALEHYERSHGVRAAALGETAAATRHVRLHIADTLAALGRTQDAVEIYSELLSSPTARDQIDLRAWAKNGLARILLDRGDAEGAWRLARETTASKLEAEARHLDYRGRLDIGARALTALGRPAEALGHAHAVIPVIAAAYGWRSREVGYAFEAAAQAAVALGLDADAFALGTAAAARLASDPAVPASRVARVERLVNRARAASVR